MTLPLERFRMLDLTRLVPGPMATWMLAGSKKRGRESFHERVAPAPHKDLAASGR